MFSNFAPVDSNIQVEDKDRGSININCQRVGVKYVPADSKYTGRGERIGAPSTSIVKVSAGV